MCVYRLQRISSFVSENTDQLLVPMRKCKQEVSLSCQSSWISVILSCRVKHPPTKIQSKSKCGGRAIIKCCRDPKENNSLRNLWASHVKWEPSPDVVLPPFLHICDKTLHVFEWSECEFAELASFIYLLNKKAFIFRGRLYTQEPLHFSLLSAQLRRGSFMLTLLPTVTLREVWKPCIFNAPQSAQLVWGFLHTEKCSYIMLRAATQCDRLWKWWQNQCANSSSPPHPYHFLFLTDLCRPEEAAFPPHR